MDAHDHQADTGQGRVRRLYDRLAAVLRRLSPNRRAAFREHWREQEQKEKDDDGGAEGSGEGER